jgi:hypothetical protein
LLIVGAIIHYFWWLVRADQQHPWALVGDQRGLYGDHPPVLPVMLASVSTTG